MTEDKKAGLTKDKKVDIPDETTWREAPWLALKGFLMGTADIIPGVSGGTMALITGIYDRLINAIRSVDNKVILSLLTLRMEKLFSALHWKFIMILLIGIFTAIFFFTRIIPLQVYMYTHPEIIYGLFFGLILGSVFVLLKEVDSKDHGLKKAVPLFFGTVAGFWIVMLVPADTPENFWFVFLSGFIVFCALILPGVSGSYLLLILGKYDYVLTQLAGLGSAGTTDALWALFPLFLGGAAGLAFFSRILSWLLRNYHTMTLMVLVGFLIGSLYVIWPWQDRVYEEEIIQTETYSLADPFVQKLKANPPDTTLPSYTQLGEIIQPEDNTIEKPPHIEVEYIKRNLVHSKPFIPVTVAKHHHEVKLWDGIIGFLLGLFLVGGLDFLRRKK